MGVNDALGLKSIKEYNKQSLGEMVSHHLNSAWYFEKFYEKLILIGLCILGLWKLVGFF